MGNQILICHIEDSSVQERIAKQTKLKTFGNHEKGIPFAIDDYLALVGATGRVIINEYKGYISGELSGILLRLRLNNEIWLQQIKHFDKWYDKVIGTVDNLKKYCQFLN